jgi:hypothetical protein
MQMGTLLIASAVRRLAYVGARAATGHPPGLLRVPLAARSGGLRGDPGSATSVTAGPPRVFVPLSAGFLATKVRVPKLHNLFRPLLVTIGNCVAVLGRPA